MLIAFIILMLASIICYFIAGIKDNGGFGVAAFILSAIAGIILIIITVQAPSKTKVNMFFLGTLIFIMCAGLPVAIGYRIGKAIRNKKKDK